MHGHYRIAPFDEKCEQEASRKFIFSELYKFSKEMKHPWVFEPEYPGKSIVFNGQTGDPFQQPVPIEKSYILKLINQVDGKNYGRSTRPYFFVIQHNSGPCGGTNPQGFKS